MKNIATLTTGLINTQFDGYLKHGSHTGTDYSRAPVWCFHERVALTIAATSLSGGKHT